MYWNIYIQVYAFVNYAKIVWYEFVLRNHSFQTKIMIARKSNIILLWLQWISFFFIRKLEVMTIFHKTWRIYRSEKSICLQLLNNNLIIVSLWLRKCWNYVKILHCAYMCNDVIILRKKNSFVSKIG